MEFKKHKPHKKLEHIVAYFWTLQLSSKQEYDSVYRFVPDGYVDWIFHLKEPWQCYFPNVEFKNTEKFHVFGQIKNHVDLHIQNNQLDLFGVKFFPFVTNKLWNVDMHYLTDNCVSLEELNLSSIKILQDKVVNSKSTAERISLVQDYLFGHIKYSVFDTSTPLLVSNLNTQNLEPKTMHSSVRRIEQRYKNEIGISPKRFKRILKINKVIDDLKRKKKHESLTQIALQNNYYDQSHFIKDFRLFTGFSPKQFLKSINPNGDILNLRVS